MSVEELDITPDEKGILFEERQFTIERFPITVNTFSNTDGMKLVKLHTSTYSYVPQASLQHHAELVLDVEDTRKLVSLLLHSINYLKEKK